jgi:GNAT superfamily N-acetyltransferase
MWRRLLGGGTPSVHVAVAETGGQVAGFYSIGPPNEPAPPNVQMLHTLYLHPGMTRQGIGRMLLSDAEDRMRQRGAGSGYLRVMTRNGGSRVFYERLGWSADTASIRIEDAWGLQVETIRYAKVL